MKAICSECKQECFPKIVDLGIGSYEYWGATGVDVQLSVESDCCEDEVIDKYGKSMTVEDAIIFQEDKFSE